MKKLLSMLLALALVLALGTCGVAEQDWVTPVQHVENWDREVDFLVVGYGLAGAAAAVEAYDIDPTAEILVLEKMPRALAGGNSIASGQTRLRALLRPLRPTCTTATSRTRFRTSI